MDRSELSPGDDGREDETDEILRDPGSVAGQQQTRADLDAGPRTYSLEEVRTEMAGRAMADRELRNQARRAHLLEEMTRKAVEDGLYEASAADYTEALRRARGKDPVGHRPQQPSQLTAQVNAVIEKSGDDEDETAWVVEMSHKLMRELADDWGPAPDPVAIREIVAELNAQLGTTLVAALSGSRNCKQPYNWESGTSRPDGAAERRLRVAHQLFSVVAAEESTDIARALFIGMNPVLHDDTIITALREDRFEEAYAAVRMFLTDGWGG